VAVRPLEMAEERKEQGSSEGEVRRIGEDWRVRMAVPNTAETIMKIAVPTRTLRRRRPGRTAGVYR
jgi:hypothetical protein